MSRPLRIHGAALLGALLLLGACRDKPAAAPPATPEVVVRALQASTVPLHTELPGRTAPFMTAEVRPQVGGIIRKQPFTEGSQVKTGQVLYEIDPAPFQAAVSQQEGALANAQASVNSTRALAERYKVLLAHNGVSKQEYDNAQAAFGQAQAQVQVQKALLETARINLQNTRVTAPIAGYTSRSAVTPGALVSAAQPTALLTISQLDPIYVDISQSSTEIMRLRQAMAAGTISRDAQGQRVSLMLEDGSTYAREGRIQLTEVTVDPSSGSVTLRAKFPNPDGLLMPGMFVRTVVTEGSTPNGIVVPQSSIKRDRRGNPTARLVTADNKLESRPVVIERSVGTNWLVSEGLKAGDRLVLEGAQNAQPGATVKVIDESAAPAPKPNAPGSSATPPQNGTPVAPQAAGAATSASTASTASTAPSATSTTTSTTSATPAAADARRAP